MTVYYFICFWGIITGGIFVLKNRDFAKKFFLLLNFIPIIFIAGFRDIINGRDTFMYINIYNTIKDTDWNYIFDVIPRIDKGYLLINKLISLLDVDYTGFFLIISLITYTAIAIFFYRYSFNVWISVYLFITNLYIYDPFNIIRQMLALSIILIGFKLFFKEKYKYFILVIIIASTIHLSAMLFLLLLLFKVKDNSINKLIVKWIIVVFCVMGLVFLFKPLLSLIDTYSYIINNIVVEDLKFGFLRNCIYALFPLVMILYGLKHNIYENDEKKYAYLLLNTSFFFLLINILSYTVTGMFSRLASYCQIFICLAIPLSLKIFNKNVRIMINILILLCWGVYYYYYLNMQHNSGLIQEYLLFI